MTAPHSDPVHLGPPLSGTNSLHHFRLSVFIAFSGLGDHIYLSLSLSLSLPCFFSGFCSLGFALGREGLSLSLSLSLSFLLSWGFFSLSNLMT